MNISKQKEAFLLRLKSPSNPYRYKRYLGSPLRYAGGKSLAVGYVVELLPNNLKRVISPFFGGGAVEIAIAKELKVPVLGFDIFDILINYWKYQIQQPKTLAERLSSFSPSREEYKKVKEKMKAHWDGKQLLTGLELAAVYYFNHNMSYGPHFLGSPSSVYLQPKRYKSILQKVAGFDVKNIKVDTKDFADVIKKYPNDFLYCDPPYFLGGDSRMFVGMYPHRNFPIHHKNFKHEVLRDLLKKHKGGFILSYNNCSTIRDYYKEFNMIFPSWQYTFGQGDTRIGINREHNNHNSYIKSSHEVIIWKMPE